MATGAADRVGYRWGASPAEATGAFADGAAVLARFADADGSAPVAAWGAPAFRWRYAF